MRTYEKHPTADAYRVGASYTPYAIVAAAKRFSDAELMAEFYKAKETVWVRRSRWDRYQELSLWDHMNAEHDKADTLLRFATLPHYDEDPQ